MVSLHLPLLILSLLSALVKFAVCLKLLVTSSGAQKRLAGHGDIYLRLTRSFLEDVDAASGPSSPLPPASIQHNAPVSVTASTSSDVVPVASISLSVDRAGTIDLTSSESHHSSDDEFPPFPEYLPKERLYEIFSQVSSSAVDDIIDLCD